MNLLAVMEEGLRLAIEFGILLLEYTGVCVLLMSTVRGILGCVRHDSHVRLRLAEGIALALEFKLGGEVLHTVLVHEWNELLVLGGIILLRGALTFLIHWEIQHEEKRLAMEQAGEGVLDSERKENRIPNTV